MKDHTDTTSGTNIADLGDLRTRRSYSALAQIEGYWESLRGNRLMPLRAEIDPRGLKGALEHCFILERVAPGIARVRVAGSHLSDLLGMEVRGMPITSFLTADARRAVADAMEEVFETPACVTVELTSEAGFGRPALKARMIMMPVRSDLGDTSRILGGLVAEGDIGRAPRRFSVDSIKLRPLVAQDAPTPMPKAAKTPVETPKTVKRAMIDAHKTQIKPRPAAPAPKVDSDEDRFETVIPGVSYLRLVKT